MLVQQYADTPVEERNRLDFLGLVQVHLSPAAFQRMLNAVDENTQQTPSSSQGSQPANTQAFMEDFVELACSSAPATGTAEVSIGDPLPSTAFLGFE